MRFGGGVDAGTPASDEDLPIFDEARLQAVEFAPRAVRSPGRDWRMVAGAWAIAVVSLIGVGLLTSAPDETNRARDLLADEAGPAPTGDPGRLARDLPSTRMGSLLLRQVIQIDSPSHGREVTTPQVDVSGSMLVRADHVGIALEARGNRVLDHVWVDVFDPDGGVRPRRTPSFGASFDLPFPRPNGTMWVVVTAYDERGMPLGSTRRPFSAGPLAPAAAVPLGHGGLDGPGPWGANLQRLALAGPLPTCVPVSTTLASRC